MSATTQIARKERGALLQDQRGLGWLLVISWAAVLGAFAGTRQGLRWRCCWEGEITMKELLRRIFLIDLLKGLRLTFSYQRPSATYTEQYPLERPTVAERYRGAPRLNNHPETGETLCIACNLCSLACPENLIVVAWDGPPAVVAWTIPKVSKKA